MKTRIVTLMLALALTGICAGQESEEEKKFYEDYAKSEERTIATYPDAAKPDSPLSVKMLEIEKSLKLAGDPLYNSSDKPMILAERAAKELGVVALGAATSQQTPEEIKFYDDYEKSELRTLAVYPDAAKADSPITKKMAELDKALEAAGDPLYNSADKPMILAERAANELGIAPLAADADQQTPEEKEYYAHFEKSLQRAIAAYPDVDKVDSGIAKKMIEMDKALEATDDPLYNSAEKPMILAERAAKELGVVAIETLAAEPDMVMEPGWSHYRPKAFKYEDEVIPEFLSYKAVRVRKVEPDGLKIIHESGATKIEIEYLTTDQRLKYGLTMEGAAQYRRQVAANTATYYANQRIAAIQAQADAQVAAEAERERQEQIRANPPRVVQAPVWKRYVQNEAFRKANREGITDEIRRQDGDAAAESFLTEERLKALEGSIKDGRRAAEQSNDRRENMSRQIEMQQQEMERKQREIERQQEEIERRQREIEWQQRQ